jgi:hypothetical protein
LDEPAIFLICVFLNRNNLISKYYFYEQNNYMDPDYTVFPERQPMEYATWWNRFFTTLIDGCILVLPLTFIDLYLCGDDSFKIFMANLIVYWLYDALQESGPNMATIGKKAMR